MAKTVSITSNVALSAVATSGATSQVLEPSVATNGDNIVVTSNWFASRSSNAGGTWSYVNPYTSTPPAADGFCCDQLVLFDELRTMWIWIKQYSATTDGENVFRIVICKSDEFDPSNVYWWDIAPTGLDSSWSGVWFDYPDAALSADNLYVTFNVFNEVGAWQRAVVMRFPLAALSTDSGLSYDWWSTTSNGSIRLTQQASPGSDMYFASHSSSSELKLFLWPDNSNSIDSWNINVIPWSRSISSIAPNGVDWLSRCDSRITAGSLGGSEIAFMWTSGASGGRPNPYCNVVRIDESTKSVIDQPALWSKSGAWCYPACCYNSNGELGISAFFGGGSSNPSHIVGFYDTSVSSWTVKSAKAGSNSPNAGRWGDYINVRADVPDGSGWVASGFTEEGGDTGADIVPRVVRFQSVAVGASS